MRRSDRQITDESEIRDIVECARIVHLGMIDGTRPYVVPLHYGCEWHEDGLTLWCHGAREGRKIDPVGSLLRPPEIRGEQQNIYQCRKIQDEHNAQYPAHLS